jgi:tRNA dimethylallyltransferase
VYKFDFQAFFKYYWISVDLPEWRNGSRARLKIVWRNPCGFKSHLWHLLIMSTTRLSSRTASRLSKRTPKHTRIPLLVVCGQTATGKSGLAVDLARALDGEIISADSRQVYRGLDLGTGKVTDAEMRGVPHHLLDVASARSRFTVARFVQLGEKAIRDIVQRGHLPIICGGTGFYIQALVDGIVLPEVPPDEALRKKLSTLSAEKLYTQLKKLDPARASTIDRNNPQRLIRAIEIAKHLGAVPAVTKKASPYDVLFIGTAMDGELLKKKIARRLAARLRLGMLKEALRLHRGGLSWRRMRELGLEYRFMADYFAGSYGAVGSKEALASFTAALRTAIWQYARRQKTWFARDRRIQWIDMA